MFHEGRRVNHPLMRLVICESDSEGDSGRVAFAAAKRLGCAVVRNRSKRVMRVAAQTCDLPVDGYDIIMFATPRTRSATPDELEGALRSLLKRAHIQTVCNEQ